MKTKFLAAIPFLAFSVLTAQMAQAAPIESTLTLSGQIAPVACDMNFVNGGTFDYGNIPATSFAAAGSTTALAPKSLNYTITCAGTGAQIALRTSDNRSTTVNNPGSSAPTKDFGLGTDGTNNIGYNRYAAEVPTVNSSAGRFVVSTDAGVSWVVDNAPVLENLPTTYLSFTDSTGTAPIAVTNVTGPLTVTPVIGDKANLDLTGDVHLDGFATMELLYL